MPGRPAGEVEICAKAQRVDRRPDCILHGSDRGEVDDRDHLARHVGKAVAGRVQNLGRTAQFVGAIRREKSLDRRAPLRAAEIAARRLVPFGIDG